LALVDGVEHRLDRPERPHQRRGGLVAHPGDPGQAVAGVTAQRREVRVRAAGDLVPGRDRGLVHDVQLGQPPGGVDHPDGLGVVDKLEQVAVPGHDVHRSLFGRAQRADHVVRLVPGRGRHRHPGRGQHLLDDRHLHGERVWHLLGVLALVRQPVRLVGRQRGHPEGGPPVRVHAGHEPARVARPDQPGDHVEQSAHRVDRGAVGRGQGLRHAIERAEVQRSAVEQH
jgi:hypothetical protein